MDVLRILAPVIDLARFETTLDTYGDGAADRKRRRIREAGASRLASASSVERVHEALCRLRAYPDGAGVLRDVESLLRGFALRRDLREHRDALAGSGIAGTSIPYRFFWPTARWLARRWPARLRIDWDEAEDSEPRLRAALPALLPWIAAEAVRRSEAPTRALLDRLRGNETDAAFVIGLLDRLDAPDAIREATHDAIDLPYVLDAAPDAPSRTLARAPRDAIVFRTAPFARTRPDLALELTRPPRSVRELGPRAGECYVDLAREAMVTRSRDLDAFCWGNPRDVRLVDDGDGLRFALIGLVPEKRLPLPVVYGWITLQNGVPIGYVQTDALLGGVEVSFNTFPTFRGGEAARVFARVLAVSRHLFDARAFSIEPYQLGHHNAEGIASGAWWFYRKLGFAPRHAKVRKLAAREELRMRARSTYRSSESVLEHLAAAHLFWEPDPMVRARVAEAPRLGLRLPPGGGDEAASRVGLASMRGWSSAERMAWERLAPVVLAMRGIERWSAEERARLAGIVRAKAARRETEFLVKLAAHEKAARELGTLLVSD